MQNKQINDIDNGGAFGYDVDFRENYNYDWPEMNFNNMDNIVIIGSSVENQKEPDTQ